MKICFGSLIYDCGSEVVVDAVRDGCYSRQKCICLEDGMKISDREVQAEAWSTELVTFLSASSPERFALWNDNGELPIRVADAAEWIQTKHIDDTVEDGLLEEAKRRLAAASLNYNFPLGLAQADWELRLHEYFRAASPESYAIADAAGRAAPNIAALVSKAQADWKQILSATPLDLGALSALQEELLTQSSSIHRPVIKLADLAPATGNQAVQSVASAQATRLPDFFVLGPERSGTTVIGAAISTSPDVFVLNDTMVFLRWISMAFQIAETRKVAAKHGMVGNVIPDLPDNLDAPAYIGHVKWLLSMLGSTYYGAGINDAEPNKNLEHVL